MKIIVAAPPFEQNGDARGVESTRDVTSAGLGEPRSPLKASAGEMKEQGWAICCQGLDTCGQLHRQWSHVGFGQKPPLASLSQSQWVRRVHNKTVSTFIHHISTHPTWESKTGAPLVLLSLSKPVLEAVSNVLEVTGAALRCSWPFPLFPVCAGLSFSFLLSSPPVAGQRDKEAMTRSVMLCGILLRLMRGFAAWFMVLDQSIEPRESPLQHHELFNTS